MEGLRYEGRVVDRHAGEQFSSWYLRLNSAGVMPTLVDDHGPIVESSVTVQYVDDLSDPIPLMPWDPHRAALARRYLMRCLEVNPATNSLSFATIGRLRELDPSEGDWETDYSWKPNPVAAAKRHDLVEAGVNSSHVDSAVRTFASLRADMDADLCHHGDWLLGAFSLVNIGMIAYVDRLKRLGLHGFWVIDHPRVGEWLRRFRKRPSYVEGIEAYAHVTGAPDTYRREVGRDAWPLIGTKLSTAKAARG